MAVDPVTLQVLVGGLHSICAEMGATLIRSAHSPNIKERQDCSTALFDAGGELVMQAEHIPVHLGSMPAAVGAIRDEVQSPGDLWIICTVNGEEFMRVNTRDQPWSMPDVLEHVTREATLEPGDMFSTGPFACAADGMLKPGDVVECAIEGITLLRTTIVAAEGA